MKAIVVTDPKAGTAGMTLQERPDPDTDLLASLNGGRSRTHIGRVTTLDDAVAALNSTERVSGKTIINVRP